MTDITPTADLISINEAASQGIDRVRKPIWANPLDHLKIDIFDGRSGPWLHLFRPFNKECNGRDPVDVLVLQFDCNDSCYVVYTGPLPDSAEYMEAVALYDGCLGDEAGRRKV